MFKKKVTAKDVIRVQREPKPYEQPMIPYKRSAILVKQSSVNWIFEMLKQGQGKVVVQYFILWFLFIAAIVVAVLVVLKLTGLFDWLIGLGGG